MSSLYDFDDKWTGIVEKAYSEDHGALTDHEKIWFNIQCLIEAVNNGGFVDYYSSSVAETVDDCLHALDVIGAVNSKKLVERVKNSLFEHGVPKDTKKRNMEMDHWPASKEAVINDVEIAYFTQEENIEELLVNFIVEKGIGAESVTGGLQ
ncbi:MAG: DUF4375 domain-containing protein [Gammaproteobacteria bacterium]